ncbi:MAG TPA: carboxypeptidase-like regulatory domain-containing protein [Candidatus Xenobia bacterium]|nr:carboxypeptidase-like regulatory domain-containing protein [Candidatus Xenobia bacterium]
MKRLARLLAAFLFAASLQAQQPQPPPPEKCVVEGQVVKAGTGQPLKKARVVLRKEESQETPQTVGTDADGKFQFKNVEPGRYRVYAVRNGYVRQEYGQRGPTRPGTVLTLAPGQQLRDIVFKLQPAAVIAGRVYDEDGEAVMGARVQALQFRYFQGRRQLFPARTATTNDRGEYRLIGLAPGRYFVSVTYTPTSLLMAGLGFEFPGGQAAVDEGYAPVYYPNTTDASRATPFEVKAGNEIAGIDVLLLPTRTARIRGRIFNAVTGKPGRESMLMIWPREEASRGFFTMSTQNRVDDPQGNFELKGVAPGSYTLVAIWWDSGKSYAARLPLDVGGNDIDGVQLTIQPGVQVAGSIRVEGAEPAAAAAESTEASFEKQTKLDWTEVYVGLATEDWSPFGGGSARAREDGSFVIENVSDDSYRVTVSRLPPDYYLKSARMEGNDLLEEGLTIAGPPRSTLELVVSPNGARLEGVVLRDSKPFSGATVTLVPDEKHRKRRELFKTASTDQYGRFTLRGIAPGEYKLYAWEEIEPGAYEDSEYLKPYEKRGMDVRLDESSKTTVELTLIPAGEPR